MTNNEELARQLGVAVNAFLVTPILGIFLGVPSIMNIITELGGKQLELNWFLAGFIGMCLGTGGNIALAIISSLM